MPAGGLHDRAGSRRRPGLRRPIPGRDADVDGVRPRILSAGSPLTISGGHCWYLGGIADTATEIRDAIDRAAETADLIKIMAGGGYVTSEGPTPFDAQYSTELLRVAVDHAAHYGLTVAAHAHGTETDRPVHRGRSSHDRALWVAVRARKAGPERLGGPADGPAGIGRRRHDPRRVARDC
ncbi:hypothetical protein DMP15_29900 [Pseudonocardia sp. UM4_GMWB1]|uniref:amidohydrolase family protein n=1 Tax=Pseudonocardia sp. UM4_GMWB1 TaxID=2212989 RepID=UPI0030B5D365